MRGIYIRLMASAIGLCMPAYAMAQPAVQTREHAPDIGVDAQAAFAFWDKQVKQAEHGKDRLTLANALAERANALLQTDRIAEAQADCERGLALVRTIAPKTDTRRARQLEADLLLVQTQTYSNLQKLEESLTTGRMVRAIRADLFGEDSVAVAEAESALASTLISKGVYEEGLATALRAWNIAQAKMPKGDPSRINIGFQYAVGLVYSRQAKAAEAMLRTLADEMALLPPGHLYRSKVFNLLGTEMLMQGRTNESIPYLREAVDQGRASKGKIKGENADSVATLGIALLMQDRPDDALPILLDSIDMFAEAKAVPSQAGSYINAGTAADRSGDRQRGMELREKGLALFEQLPSPHPLGLALNRFKLAQSYAHVGRLEEAEAMEQQAVDVIAQLRPEGHFQRTNSQIALGWIKTLRGDAAGGMALIKPAFQRSLAESRALEVAQNKVVGVLDNIEAFSQALDAAVRAGDREFAFEVMQVMVESDASRAAAAAQARAQSGGSELGALLLARQEAAAAAMDAEKAAIKAASEAPAEASAARTRADAAAKALADLNIRLDAQFPGYRALLRPLPITIAEAQAKLGKDDALLVTVSSDEGLYTFALTERDMAIGKSPERRPDVRRLVSAIRSGIDTMTDPAIPESFDVVSAHALYQAIFTPEVAGVTARAKRLYIASDDILSAIPFSLLAVRAGKDVGDTRWLIEDKAVAVTPSLTAMTRVNHAEKSDKQGKRFVGIGAPQLSGTGTLASGPSYFAAGLSRSAQIRSIPPLPSAERELKQMAGILSSGGKAEVLTGDAAQEAALRALDLRNISVLAFATHGLVAGQFDQVSEPALVFTPPADEATTPDNDGILTASESSMLNIDADWVILSACNTAAGDRPSAAGYTGLARAFLFAGGKRVLASHWPVRDDISAKITVATVQAFQRKAEPADALRTAILATMRDTSIRGARNPAVWAPFMLVGQ